MATLDRDFDVNFISEDDELETDLLGVNASLADFARYYTHLRDEDVQDFVHALVHAGVFESVADAEARRETWAVLWLLFIQWGYSVGRRAQTTPIFIMKRIPLNGLEFVVFIGSHSLNKHLKKVLPPVKRHINGLTNAGKTLCTSVDRRNKKAVRFAEHLGFVKIEEDAGKKTLSGIEDFYDTYVKFPTN